MPADVFAALEDIEFPFFRERLEAEFKSLCSPDVLLGYSSRPERHTVLTMNRAFRVQRYPNYKTEHLSPQSSCAEEGWETRHRCSQPRHFNGIRRQRNSRTRSSTTL